MPRFRPDEQFRERLHKATESAGFDARYDQERAKFSNLGGARPGSGRKPFEPQDWQYKVVEKLAGIGVSQLDICVIIGASEHVFRAHFNDAWVLGKSQAKAIVAGKLFQHILNDNLAATIFYARVQMGWVEAKGDEPPTSDSVEAMDDDDIRREIASLDARAATASKARSLATRM